MRHTSEDHLSDVAAELAQRLREKIAGEVRFDSGSRALYATDLSVYRQVPIGVVIPRDVEDVIEAVALCRQYQVPILGRGCGTSLAGQCCNVAVILDFSKHLNRVLAIDPARKTATVEPGVINDGLRNAAEQYHLTFGPDPATHAYCTLGGNIGNNSCDAHSVMAGRTVDNVEELEILTYDGLRMKVGATSDLLLAEVVRQGGRRGAIYAALRELRDKYADEIRRRYPKIPRRVSGYNLDELLPEKGFNVARALVGSESTCALVLKATVQLVDSPAHRALVVVGFPDIFSAADVCAEIRHTTQPLALEAISEHVLQNMEREGRHPAANLLPSGGSWLLVEFGGSSSDEAGERARAAAESIRAHVSGHSGMSVLEKREEQQQIWHLRESGVAASRVPGVEDSWPSWEDSAVAPERLGPYLRDLVHLIESYGYKWTVFGHFGDGCIHSRIAFDLKTRRGVERFRSFMFDAADLVVGYGGSLSGEHGDGQARAELLPKMFGRELVNAFAEFKQIWDPSGKMNPNKIVEPHRLDQDLRERGFHRRQPPSQLSRQSFTLTEFLIDQADYQPPRFEGAALVHNHCHHKALIGTDAETKLFQRMGLNARMPDFGCCGMAGPFGYRQDHYDISMRIGEQSLLPAVRDEPPANLIVADGFSCREQIAHATGRQALHPAEVLRMAIENEQSEPRPSMDKRRFAARAIPAAAALALIAVAGANYMSSARIIR